MERRPEAAPKSLAQLIARRGRNSRTDWPTAQPTADALGQFGLLFNAPEPAVEAEAPQQSSAPAPHLAPAPAAERKLWSVAELVGVLRGRLEREYSDVWVEGEISNAKLASSGAFYFTLKDGEAQLPAVLFRRQAGLLRWKPTDGMAVLARGRISVFETRGQLQLIAESLEPRGAGALQLQFEQLKSKLREEGLFAAERKRPLPAYPGTIGVVTSTQGAVIRDIVTVCRRRHGCMNILVYPAAVQGTSAAAEILAGVRFFNASATHRVDVIVVARGGGSTEDLWAFNDEALARGIVASHIPVVSAVGHETDFTIADFVADLRAPTPSAAAELITEAQHRAQERVDTLRARLLRGVRWQSMSARQRFSRISATGALRRVPEALERRMQRLDTLELRLRRAMETIHLAHANRLRHLHDRVRRQDAGLRVAASRASLAAADARLRRLAGSLVARSHSRLGRATLHLQALSPVAVLERGYALAFHEDGRLLRSVTQAAPNTPMTVRLADGTVFSRIVGTEPALVPVQQTAPRPGKEEV